MARIGTGSRGSGMEATGKAARILVAIARKARNGGRAEVQETGGRRSKGRRDAARRARSPRPVHRRKRRTLQRSGTCRTLRRCPMRAASTSGRWATSAPWIAEAMARSSVPVSAHWAWGVRSRRSSRVSWDCRHREAARAALPSRGNRASICCFRRHRRRQLQDGKRACRRHLSGLLTGAAKARGAREARGARGARRARRARRDVARARRATGRAEAIVASGRTGVVPISLLVVVATRAVHPGSVRTPRRTKNEAKKSASSVLTDLKIHGANPWKRSVRTLRCGSTAPWAVQWSRSATPV
mmetsp:Transcript_92004/g.197137  ORF Transcript_92004/g.197137 Transcript_92004/m.197137 type:complete len:300 (-) Transcript_92004:1261-2160(-)